MLPRIQVIVWRSHPPPPPYSIDVLTRFVRCWPTTYVADLAGGVAVAISGGSVNSSNVNVASVNVVSNSAGGMSGIGMNMFALLYTCAPIGPLVVDVAISFDVLFDV